VIIDSQEMIMAGYEQFGELPEQVKPQADAAPAGAPRLRQPRREQIELRAVDIDSLIGKDHPVRVIWAYGSSVDTSKSRDPHNLPRPRNASSKVPG
jgi:hypothetical protein